LESGKGFAAARIGPKYDSSFSGHYGELGVGRYGVRFIQSAVSVGDLDKLKLISQLPGSERWPIRNLFQRDVDQLRVINEIAPYFEEEQAIKFFNPLTIVLLPCDSSNVVLPGVKETQSVDREYFKGLEAKVFEAEGFYRIITLPESPEYSAIYWKTDRVWALAVDGQHRLSALKHLKTVKGEQAKRLHSVGFHAWSIPVVVIVFPPVSDTKSQYLLDNCRDIFVTINKEAKPPNKCRTILLNDRSVIAMCCQEFLEHCYREASMRKGKGPIPLVFFDWRAHYDGDAVENPASFLRVEELKDIQLNYLIGEDEDDGLPSTEQRDSLYLNDMDEELDEFDLAKMRSQIRTQYNRVLRATIEHVLSSFTPWKLYIDFLRKMIERCGDGRSPYLQSALEQIVYGVTAGAIDPQSRSYIDKETTQLLEECKHAKEAIPFLFERAIGVRGLFCGLQLARKSYDAAVQTVSDWETAANWYLPAIETAYKRQLFKRNNSLLRHIAFDPLADGHVLNYRLEDSKNALGAYCALIACAADKRREEFGEEIEEYLQTLDSTLFKGYRRERAAWIEQNNPELLPRSNPEFKKKRDQMAKQDVSKHIARIRQEFGINS
jgi:hypothetical protein